jgi:hypothetical protein
MPRRTRRNSATACDVMFRGGDAWDTPEALTTLRGFWQGRNHSGRRGRVGLRYHPDVTAAITPVVVHFGVSAARFEQPRCLTAAHWTGLVQHGEPNRFERQHTDEPSSTQAICAYQLRKRSHHDPAQPSLRNARPACSCSYSRHTGSSLPPMPFLAVPASSMGQRARCASRGIPGASRTVAAGTCA